MKCIIHESTIKLSLNNTILQYQLCDILSCIILAYLVGPRAYNQTHLVFSFATFSEYIKRVESKDKDCMSGQYDIMGILDVYSCYATW